MFWTKIELIAFIVFIWLLNGAVGGDIGRLRGTPWKGFALGLLFGPAGWLITALSPHAGRSPCPFCSELVFRTARICPYCHIDISVHMKELRIKEQKRKERLERTVLITLGIVLVLALVIGIIGLVIHSNSVH